MGEGARSWASVSLSSCFPVPQTEVGSESNSPPVGQGKATAKRMSAGTRAALGSQAPEQSLLLGLVSHSATDHLQLHFFRALGQLLATLP